MVYKACPNKLCRKKIKDDLLEKLEKKEVICCEFCKTKIHKPNMGLRYVLEIETQEGKNETLQGFIDSIQRYLPDDLSDGDEEDMEEYMNEQFEGKIANKITYM